MPVGLIFRFPGKVVKENRRKLRLLGIYDSTDIDGKSDKYRHRMIASSEVGCLVRRLSGLSPLSHAAAKGEGFTYTEVGKNMSFSKTKMFLAAGLLLAMTLTFVGSASAWDGRLWKPYQPEQFGGHRRSADGLYGGIEGIYWRLSRPSSTWVGYTNSDGSNAQRLVYNGNDVLYQTNSMNMVAADSDFQLGTRVEFGHIRGHHGWLFSGYGLPSQSISFSQRDATMVIKDPENIYSQAFHGSAIGWSQVLRGIDPVTNMPIWEIYNHEMPTGNPVMMDGIPHVHIPNTGYLWGWYPRSWADPWSQGQLAPVPLTFARATVTARTSLSSVELMYTYRPHPFKWGEMQLLTGARYWGMDDEMTFIGQGFDQTIFYTTGGSGVNAPGTSNTNNNNNTIENPNPGPGISDNSGPLTVLATSRISGRVNNHIGGPQFGFKLHRRNQRWTFGTEFRFMAGINSQSQTVSGTIGDGGIDPSNVFDSPILQVQQSSMKPYMPIGLLRNAKSFYHHENKTYFSPGIELKFDAKWQWTDAIGINFGVNTLFVDNVARGANVIDYSIQPDGTLFGIRGKQNGSITAYGLHIGITARR